MKVKNKDFYTYIPTRTHRKKRINKKWLKRYGVRCLVQKFNAVNKNGRYYDTSLLNNLDNQILAQNMKKFFKGESDHVS